MLTELRLTRFKCFRHEQTVPLRPVTLLYGQNSSGKSSVLQALLLLKQSVEAQHGRRDSRSAFSLAGPLVEFSAPRDLVFGHDLSSTIEFVFRLTPEEGNVTADYQLLHRLLATTAVRYTYDLHETTVVGRPTIDAYLARCDLLGEDDVALATWSWDPQQGALVAVLGALPEWLLDALAATTAPVAADEALEAGEPEDARLSAGTTVYVQAQLAQAEAARPLRANGALPACGGEGHDAARAADVGIDEAVAQRAFLQAAVLVHTRALARLVVRDLVCLPPLRAVPQRVCPRFEPAGTSQSGDAALQRVERSEALLQEVNDWLARLKFGHQLVLRRGDGPPFDSWFVPVWRDGEVEVGIRDVGFGASQVLPVLVAALSCRRKLIVIEQPELHLHPRLQAELGELFAHSALRYGNRFLIETHSEHLLLRLRRLIGEQQELWLAPVGADEADDVPPRGQPVDGDAHVVTRREVAVLYVGREAAAVLDPAAPPGAGGSWIQELPLDASGQMIETWPEGFFDVGFDEVFG